MKKHRSACLTRHNMYEAPSTIMTEMCSNCNKDVETKPSPISTQIGNYDERGDIRIWDIIAYVYQIGRISLDEFNIHSKKVIHRHHLIDDLKEESLGMCDLCLSLLSNTYKALRQFESLTHQASVIQQVQNTFKIKKEMCTEEDALDTASDPDLNNISFPDENANSDLFESFNYIGDHTPGETDNYFTEECKAETDFDLYENESPLVSRCNSNPDIDLPQKSVTEKSQMSSKQLVVKIEKLSEKDLEFYHGKRKNCNKVIGRKGRQFVSRKIKPGKKIRSPTAIKKKYSSRKHKEEQIEQLSIPGDKKKYKCKICGKIYLNPKNLRQYHMPTHFQDMSCKMCGKVLASLKSMKWHMRLVHKQAKKEELEKYYKTCEICGMTILSHGFKQHMKTHGPREPLKCDKCDKEYFNKRAYEDHLLTHSDTFTPLLCKHCGSTFKDRQTLYIHEKKHTEEKKISCEICSMKFFYRHDLKDHMVAHTKERSFVCDECGRSYKTKYDLQTHQKKHKEIAENGEYASKCQYCERIFKHSEGLRWHMKVHEGKYKCSFCGKKLSNSEVLRKHENLHKKNPDYQPRKYYKTYKSEDLIDINLNPTT